MLTDIMNDHGLKQLDSLDYLGNKKEDSQKKQNSCKKKTDSKKLRSKFETLRLEIKDDVGKQDDLYVNNLVGDVKANPRDFYRYINSQEKDYQGIPTLKISGETGIIVSEIEQAEEFNGQFTDVFNKSDHIEVPFLSRSAPFMDDITVSNEGVTQLLKGLNPSKALGPDELHPRVLNQGFQVSVATRFCRVLIFVSS